MHTGATGDLARPLVLRVKERKPGSWASRHPYTERKGQQRTETAGQEAQSGRAGQHLISPTR